MVTPRYSILRHIDSEVLISFMARYTTASASKIIQANFCPWYVNRAHTHLLQLPLAFK